MEILQLGTKRSVAEIDGKIMIANNSKLALEARERGREDIVDQIVEQQQLRAERSDARLRSLREEG